MSAVSRFTRSSFVSLTLELTRHRESPSLEESDSLTNEPGKFIIVGFFDSFDDDMIREIISPDFFRLSEHTDHGCLIWFLFVDLFDKEAIDFNECNGSFRIFSSIAQKLTELGRSRVVRVFLAEVIDREYAAMILELEEIAYDDIVHEIER